MLKGSVRYRLESGFGAGLNVQWQSWQRGNLDNQWHIPAQYTLNGSLFYEAKRWSANWPIWLQPPSLMVCASPVSSLP